MQYDARGVSLGGLRGLSRFTVTEDKELIIHGEADGVRLDNEAAIALKDWFADLDIHVDNPNTENPNDEIEFSEDTELDPKIKTKPEASTTTAKK